MAKDRANFGNTRRPSSDRPSSSTTRGEPFALEQVLNFLLVSRLLREVFLGVDSNEGQFGDLLTAVIEVRIRVLFHRFVFCFADVVTYDLQVAIIPREIGFLAQDVAGEGPWPPIEFDVVLPIGCVAIPNLAVRGANTHVCNGSEV
jgi:hypothetical protein